MNRSAFLTLVGVLSMAGFWGVKMIGPTGAYNSEHGHTEEEPANSFVKVKAIFG